MKERKVWIPESRKLVLLVWKWWD